jgi:hypothetical protein
MIHFLEPVYFHLLLTNHSLASQTLLTLPQVLPKPREKASRGESSRLRMEVWPLAVHERVTGVVVDVHLDSISFDPYTNCTSKGTPDFARSSSIL